MKRWIIYFLFVFVPMGYAAVNFSEQVRGDIGPATSSSEVTLAAAGVGYVNCLTDVTVISGSTYTFRILNGTTTNYALLKAASSEIDEDWSLDSMFCGDSNKTMTLKVDNGTYNINYRGKIIAQ